jgi:hypothetical protein
VFVHAGCSVRSETVTEFHTPELEVLLELRPLGGRDFAVFGGIAQAAAVLDYRLVGGDDLLGEDPV